MTMEGTLEQVKGEVQQIVHGVDKVVLELRDFRIATASDQKNAAVLLQAIKARITAITSKRLEATRPLDASKKVIMDWYRGPLDKLETAEKQVKNEMVRFQAAEDQRVRGEQARLSREAKEREDRERAKLEKKAEKAEAKGDTDKADELRQQAQEVYVPAPIVAPQTEKVAGVHMMTVWKAEVTDLMALVKAVAEGRAPLMFLEASTTALTKQAKATKDGMQVPGVRFFSEQTVSSRGA